MSENQTAKTAESVIILLGMLFITVGAGWLCLPTGLIVGGLFLVLLGIGAALGEEVEQ